jgi:hypothetical protein
MAARVLSYGTSRCVAVDETLVRLVRGGIALEVLER